MSSKPPTFDIGSEWVQLGDHKYEVMDQGWPYLSHEIPEVLSAIATGEIDTSNVLAFAGGKMYDLLRVFIPDLMPEHEWRGFASQAAMQAGLYDRELARRAPKPSEIRFALQVCMKVSGLDGMKMLGNLLDPPTRAWLRAKLGSVLVDYLENVSLSDLSAPAPTPSMTASTQESPTAASTSDEPPTEAGSASSPQVVSAATG